MFLALLLGPVCAVQATGGNGGDRATENNVLGTWEYPGGEAGQMRMIFKKDNELVFADGFLFYNPARWELRSGSDELWIYINVEGIADTKGFRYQVRKGRIKSFDEGNGLIVYHFDGSTRALDFSGWIYSKKD